MNGPNKTCLFLLAASKIRWVSCVVLYRYLFIDFISGQYSELSYSCVEMNSYADTLRLPRLDLLRSTVAVSCPKFFSSKMCGV